MRSHFKKGLRWVGSYLATWRELILRPFKFVALPEDQRATYNKPGDFAAKTVALGGALGYVTARVIDDPLLPPTLISIRGTTLFYLNLAIFVAVWMFFGVFLARARRRASGPVPIREIFSTLTYLVVGTATAIELLCGLSALALLRLFLPWEPVTAFLREHFYLLMASFASICLIAFIPFFFTAWIVTRAVRRFYVIGGWRGIIIPSICWILASAFLGYELQMVTIDKLSKKERGALRKLSVLSDLEAAHYCQNQEWLDDFAELKNFVPDEQECGSDDPIVALDVLQAKSYTRNNDGYRFAIQIHDNGEGCLLRAHPLDYEDDTKLSFAKRCSRFPKLDTETVAEDAGGGDATRTGRFVLPAGDWYTLDDHQPEVQARDFMRKFRISYWVLPFTSFAGTCIGVLLFVYRRGKRVGDKAGYDRGYKEGQQGAVPSVTS